MSEKFYIEGHKPKTSIDDEETLIIDRDQSFETLEEATQKAKEYFEKKKELGLTVIYKEEPTGMKEGVKLIYRDDEGNLEESLLQG
ncbi:MAG: hypothetical protein WCC06_07650 [Candidatus Aminicenantales bacterium]